jgi:hypothetical protein
MAKEKRDILPIPAETEVDLIFLKGDVVCSKTMPYSEALQVIDNEHPVIKKKNDWTYKIYQVGFAQYSNIKKV